VNFFLAILVGAVQGLTEFMPVSSTGHLIIFENLLNISQDKFGLAFDASLHLGTLMAVLIFFHKDYLKLLNFKNKLLSLLFFATLPAVAVGLIFENQILTTFRNTTVVALGLIVFSFVMLAADYYGKKFKNKKELNIKQAIIIGIFQALALIPGISRSGSTISGGLFLGLTREEATKFAFILSAPIIAGVGIKKFIEISTSSISQPDFTFLITGILSSAIFGLITIKYFLKYIQTRSLIPFIVYRIALGTVLLLT